ncbi:MAG: tRNA 2-thiouridine(34) synthase MnmA [Planctomycetota bacterium]
MPAPLAKPGTGKKVVLAMSGGVDSSAAAALLKDDGYNVVGVFMRNGAIKDPDPDEACQLDLPDDPQASPLKPRASKQGCCSVNDADDARLVAATLGIPFYVLNFQKDFGRIMDYFTAEYNAGRTPNPCVRCNDWLKFGKLHDYAQSIDAHFVASGHYARTDLSNPQDPKLLRGIDHSKDQSYVLFGIPRDQLAHMLLPIGGLEKTVTRQIAESAGLPTFNKPDSQEICFVPDQDYAALVEKRTPGGFSPGRLVNTDGETLAEHDGHQHYTIGQRRRLGVALGYPLYVVNRDPQTNTVTVGSKDDLLSTACTGNEANWLTTPPPPGQWIDCQLKVRYNGNLHPAQVRIPPRIPPDGNTDQLEARYDPPLEAVTPGQAMVAYGPADTPLADTVLAGAWINTVDP